MVESLKVPISNEPNRYCARHLARVRANGRPVHAHRFHGNELLCTTADDEVQLSDVRNLLAAGCDAAYLRHWTRELGLDNLLQDCLE